MGSQLKCFGCCTTTPGCVLALVTFGLKKKEGNSPKDLSLVQLLQF